MISSEGETPGNVESRDTHPDFKNLTPSQVFGFGFQLSRLLVADGLCGLEQHGREFLVADPTECQSCAHAGNQGGSADEGISGFRSVIYAAR